MKKLLYITLFVLSYCTKIYSQAPAWDWVNGISGVGNENPFSVISDRDGNYLITGHFGSPFVTIGSDTLFNFDGGGNTQDIFLAKLDSLGNVIWIYGFGGNKTDTGNSLVIDSTGNIILTGNFNSPTINFGSFTLLNADSSGYSADIFLVKISSSGSVIWAKRNGGLQSESGNIALDSNQDIILAGSFSSPVIHFANDSIVNNGITDGFVFKYDNDGNELWASFGSGNGYDFFHDVALDSNRNILIIGQFRSDSLVMDGIILPNSTIGSVTDDVVLLKYDPTGNLIWGKTFGGTSNDVGYSVESDIHGNILYSGAFQSPSLIIGNDTLTNANSQGTSGDILYGKLEGNGNEIWAKSSGGPENDECLVIDSDLNGNFYLSGYFNSSTITLDSISLNNPEFYDVFVGKFNNLGNVEWVKQISGNDIVFLNNFSLEDNGDGLICGHYYGNILNFDSLGIVNSDASPFTSDIFVAKFSQCLSPMNLLILGDSLICAYESATLFASAGLLNPETTFLWNGPNNFSSTTQGISGINTPGQYICTVSNGPTCSISQTFNLSVSPNPNPIITQAGNDLICDPFVSYQWFLDSVIINGAVNQIITPTVSGLYWVMVTDSNGCEGLSSGFFVTVTELGLKEITERIIPYPIPFEDRLTLQIPSTIEKGAICKVLNFMGQVVYEEEISNTGNLEIETVAWSPGVYLVSISKHEILTSSVRVVKK
jgi:hypothetical protein